VLSDRLLREELDLRGRALAGLRLVLRVAAPAAIAAAAGMSLLG